MAINWNLSEKAARRVKDPIAPPKICNCCGGDHISIECNDVIYHKPYGKWPWIYLCNDCRAYVGIHPQTNIPLGTLADGPTRKARIRCKEPFQNLFKSGRMTQQEAYSKLAEKLGLTRAECHFGLFDVSMCEKAAAAAREIFLESLEKK